MGEFAKSLSDPASLLSMAVAVAMFMTVVGVMLPALKGDKLETRLKQVSSQREKLRRANRANLENSGLKRESKGTINDITKRLDLQKMLEDPNIEAKMEQAGMRGPRPLTIFYFFRFVLPFIVLFCQGVCFVKNCILVICFFSVVVFLCFCRKNLPK